MLTRCFEPDHEMRDYDCGILCNRCQHQLPGGKCKAFPDGIPMAILRSGEHFTSIPGDNGIIFQEKV